MTGKIGGEGSKDELDAYLRTIAASVVLKNQTKQVPKTSQTSSPASGSPSAVHAKSRRAPAASGNAPNGSSTERTETHSQESGSSSPASSVDQASTASEADSNTPLLTPLPIAVETSEVKSAALAGAAGSASDDSNGVDDDYDVFNPFAEDYQSPADKRSLESSLASLANESTHSSIPDIATYDVNTDHTYPRSLEDRYAEEADSPVDLHEYECLDMDSIPKYDAFKPSIRSRERRMNAAIQAITTSSLSVADARMSKSVDSITVARSAVEASGDGSGNGNATSMHSSFPSLRVSTNDGDMDVQTQHFLGDERTRSVVPPAKNRPHRIMDMNYSYDFQREQEYNPFVSPPPPAFLQRQVDAGVSGGIESIRELDLGSTPQIREEIAEAEDLEDDGGIRELDDVEISSELQKRTQRLSEDDETDALIAAIAAASEDDFDLFGARGTR